MPDTPDLEHRSHYRAEPGETSVDEGNATDGEDGLMSIRLPIASTGEVRNPGDDPLTDRELTGMAEQVNALDTGVFPDHGGSDMVVGGIGGDYSQFEKLGYWADGEVDADRVDGDVKVLVATAKMPDPETLPAATGAYREALAILKEQAKRGIPIDASIGWREDDDFPGGNDLMEASIVGIGADPVTNSTQDSDPVAMVARAAVDAGADREALVERVRQATREEQEATDETRPFGPPGGDDTMWEDFDECVADVSDWDNIDDPEAFCAWAEEQTKAAETDRAEYEVGDTTLDITPPDYMVSAAEAAQDAQQEGLIPDDCGTGVGDDRADQISTDEVGPDVVEEVAAYLTSHEEDVTADGPPSDWTEAEWEDCGNAQYAKWGGVGDGRAMEWAQERANAVARARDEELPYPGLTQDASDHDMTDSDTDTDEQDEQTTQATDDEEEDDEEMQALGEPMLESVDAFAAAIEDHGVEDVYEAVTDLVHEDDDMEQDVDVEALDERIADLEDALADVRSGDADVETPDPDETQDADDEETEQRDTTDIDDEIHKLSDT